MDNQNRIELEILVEESEDEHSRCRNTRERDIRPNSLDVLLGRGKSNVNHPGNKQYKCMIAVNLYPGLPSNYALQSRRLLTLSTYCIDSYLKRYLDAPIFITRSITLEILHITQQIGRFLVKKGKVWSVVPDGVARQMIAHSIQ
jgi:hypothetical protein